MDGQRNGVRYDRPVVDYRHYRFAGRLQGRVYSPEEQLVWEALALMESGTPPAEAEMPDLWTRNVWDAGKIRNLARGFAATAEDQLDDPFLGGNTHSGDWQHFVRRRGKG